MTAGTGIIYTIESKKTSAAPRQQDGNIDMDLNKSKKHINKYTHKERYSLIDTLRGLALVNMIVYHAVWDLVYMFGMDWAWYRSDAAYVWQQGICWTFILLSGFCIPLGRRTVKRGLIVFAAGAVITAVTAIAVPRDMVLFGMLTLIGSCMLLIYPIKRPLCRIDPVLGLIVSFGLFFLTRNINEGHLGFESLSFAELPDALYSNMITAYLGFPPPGFHSTDYFPLLPWIFLFVCGYFIYYIFEKYDLLKYLRSKRSNPLEAIGRSTLLIYMIHQPVLYLIFELIL